jgi:YD repeat-containing protein
LNRLTKASTYNYAALGCTTRLGQGNYHEDYSYNTGTGNLQNKTGLGDYSYDPNHKHAVTGTSGNGWTYQYDLNGNMSRRVMGGYTYDLSYDGENHLTQVNKNTSLHTSFRYDGDGNKVQAIYEGTPNDTARLAQRRYCQARNKKSTKTRKKCPFFRDGNVQCDSLTFAQTPRTLTKSYAVTQAG